jgi:hypothetical protein
MQHFKTFIPAMTKRKVWRQTARERKKEKQKK